MKTLKDLFVHTLQDVYYAEQRIVKLLPMMMEKAETNELRNVLNAHLAETEKQIQRLDEVFELVDEPPLDRRVRGCRWPSRGSRRSDERDR